MKPSFMSLSIGGLLLLLVLILLGVNWYKQNEFDTRTYQIYMLILLFSVAVSIHGIGHFLAEVYYNYDPLKTGVLTY